MQPDRHGSSRNRSWCAGSSGRRMARTSALIVQRSRLGVTSSRSFTEPGCLRHPPHDFFSIAGRADARALAWLRLVRAARAGWAVEIINWLRGAARPRTKSYPIRRELATRREGKCLVGASSHLRAARFFRERGRRRPPGQRPREPGAVGRLSGRQRVDGPGTGPLL